MFLPPEVARTFFKTQQLSKDGHFSHLPVPDFLDKFQQPAASSEKLLNHTEWESAPCRLVL